MTTSIPLEVWKKLYDLAHQIKALAPWKWMEETDVFGVREPQTGQLGFVSVMGQLGEHLSIAIYLGADGLAGFETMQAAADGDPEANFETLLETPQLQLSFEDRSDLQETDRAIIKQLGLKYRGSQSWPLFRSYRPGLFPWFIEPEEAQMLCVALQQLLEVAPRIQANPDILFDPQDSNPDHCLIRNPSVRSESLSQAGQFVANGANRELIWEDSYEPAPHPQSESIELKYDPADLEKLSKAKPVTSTLQVDLFMYPEPMREKNERPYFGYVLMMVDAQSGMILCGEILQPLPGLPAMWGKIPGVVAATLAAFNILPKKIALRSDLLMTLLEPMAKDFNIRLQQTAQLKALDLAKKEMLSFGASR